MLAILEEGSKQYMVREGDEIEVEKIQAEGGAQVELDKVLLISGENVYKVGNPYVEDAKVIGKIVRQGKAKKIIVFKFKRRKGYRKKQGHRQSITRIKIESIVG
jgi:large subunit ribosomal protein L21